MAIALAALDANNIPTETESEFGDELTESTESTENLFLRNLSKIIANSEQTSARENRLTITEVPANPQPQFGYFLPVSFTPKPRLKRLPIQWKFNYISSMTTCLFSHTRDTHESSRSPTPLNQPNHQQPPNGNNHINSRSKRFSSPPYSDYGCDKVNSRNLNGRVGKRNIRSMNEAIEVLADQVEEENVVSYALLIIVLFAESFITKHVVDSPGNVVSGCDCVGNKWGSKSDVVEWNLKRNFWMNEFVNYEGFYSLQRTASPGKHFPEVAFSYNQNILLSCAESYVDAGDWSVKWNL